MRPGSQLRLVVGSSGMGHPEVQTGSRIAALEKLVRMAARDSLPIWMTTMRQGLFICAFLLGLLGSVHSALACAADALAEDCCSGAIEMPCDHESGRDGPASDPQFCCPTTPTSAIATVSFKKIETGSLQRAAGGALAVTPDIAAWAAPARGSTLSRSSPDPDVRDGAGTYLRTLRLRL